MSKDFYNWLNRFSSFEGSEVAKTPELSYIQEEMGRLFFECVRSLSIIDIYILDKYAEFVEYDEQKGTYEGLARTLNLASENAVKQRMYRIRKNIQECLEIKYDWKGIRK